jgi:hypothetical protein
VIHENHIISVIPRLKIVYACVCTYTFVNVPANFSKSKQFTHYCFVSFSYLTMVDPHRGAAADGDAVTPNSIVSFS